MDSATRDRLVSAFVEYYTKRFFWGDDGVLREQQTDSSDLFDECVRLARDDPEDCWSFVLGVVEATGDEFVLVNLAAGPLENLINWHGPTFIERVEHQARASAKFRGVLCGVWESVEPALRIRLNALRELQNGA
jgi:hypothetical protein